MAERRPGGQQQLRAHIFSTKRKQRKCVCLCMCPLGMEGGLRNIKPTVSDILSPPSSFLIILPRQFPTGDPKCLGLMEDILLTSHSKPVRSHMC